MCSGHRDFFKAPPGILMCTQGEEAMLRTVDMGDKCSPFFHNNSKNEKKKYQNNLDINVQ